MYQWRYDMIVIITGVVALCLPHRTNGQLATTTTAQSVVMSKFANHRYYQQNEDYPQQSSSYDYVQPLTQQNGFTPLKASRLQYQHRYNNTIRSVNQLKLNRRQNVAANVANTWRRRSDYPHHFDYHESYDEGGGGHYDVHHYTAPVVRPVRYHHHIPYYADAPSPKFDITHLGLIAIFKLILLKIKAFGLFKLLLLLILKFPIIVFTLGFKFLILMKLIKLVKLLTLPALIPLIIIALLPLVIFLPLLLAPFLPLVLLPLLLPLLLLLPVPVLTPGAGTGKRRRRRSISRGGDAAVEAGRGVQDDVLHLVRRVLESEQCIERVACQLASNTQAKDYAPYIAWYLVKIGEFIAKPKFTSYTHAYKAGSNNGTTPITCVDLYTCNNPRRYI